MAQSFNEYYLLLHLKPGAGWPDLKAAYRSQIRTWHPDRQQADPASKARAEERSKAINRAYDELSRYYRDHGRLPLNPADITADTSQNQKPSEHDSFDMGGDVSTAVPTWRRFIPRAIRWFVFASLAVVVYASVKAILPSEQPPDSIIGVGTDVPMPSPANTVSIGKNANSFTLGSTLGEVYAAQGVPSRTENNVWYYGTSKIYFSNGAVIRWEETPEHPLNARLQTDSASPKLPVAFSVGSTKAEVRLVQGEPVRESEKIWDYGISRVFFEHGRVVGWHESPIDPLKIKR